MLAAFSIIVASLLSGCGGGGGGGSGSATSYYANWNCAGPQCASVMGGYSGTAGPFSSLAACEQWRQTYILSSSCSTTPGGGGGGPVAPATLTSITITPANSTLPIGLTRQFTATGRYSDGTAKDVTTQATWTANCGGYLCTSPQAATISASGLATASTSGSSTINAEIGSIRGSTTLYVTAASIQSITVTPANPTISNGYTQQFTATGHLSDGTSFNIPNQVAWSSGLTSVASINTAGLATGVAIGSSTITATWGGKSGSATLTVSPALLVSITVTPTNPIVANNFTSQFRALSTYSDGTVQDITGGVVWSSGTTSIATINAAGLATGVAVGSSAITATSGSIFGSTTLTVSAATLVSISIAPANPFIAPGTNVQFTATGNFSDSTSQILPTGVSWGSGNAPVATISSSGLANAVAVGTSTITATSGAVSANTLLAVTLTPPGMTWNYLPTSPVMVPCSTSCAFVNFRLTSVIWSGTQFVAVANNGGIFSSPDGITWTTRIPGPNSSGPGSTLMSVAWSATQMRFVAVGINYIMTSSDGITWAQNTTAPISSTTLNGVTWSGTEFVAVGNATILTSPDGLTWTPRTSGTASVLRSVAWSGIHYVAVGDVTLISPDGINWTKTADGSTGWNSIAWSGNQFIEVGSTGNIRTSADGITWTARPVQPTELNSVIWTGTQFVAVGGPGGGGASYPGYVITSPDGITWTSRTIGALGTQFGVSHTLLGVAWSGTTLVAVGNLYYTYTSP